ncbi:TPA: type IV conjugative transfer system lipoprotein TraV [Klebsiella pneumoniae]
MKELMLLIPLGSALLLTGCAGTETEFQCNATTSDTCMTMEQANEKAKLKEERSDAKPAAAGLPQLAEGNFRTTSVNSYPLPPQPNPPPGNYPRPLRKGEETTSLWIAPYVDSDDVYHQPATVLFVVKPSAWGQPRLN